MPATVAELTQLFERTTWLINAQADGLTHDDSMLQLPFSGNCFNWVLGHLVLHRDKMLQALNEKPNLTKGEATMYARGSEALADDLAAVPFDMLLAYFKDAHKRIVARLAADSAVLTAVHNAEKGATVGEYLSYLHWHETYHAGQLEILRQLAGMEDQVIK
jgi:uncharacterized damage-inducible protein DinB